MANFRSLCQKDCGPRGSDPKGSDPKGSDPKGSDPKGSDPEGSDPEGSDPKGSDPKGSDPGVFLWVVVGLLVAGCGGGESQANLAVGDAAVAEVGATFVGSEQCGTCHVGEFERWQQSHHAQAMLVASADTVLADKAYVDAELSISPTTFEVEIFPQKREEVGEGRKLPITHTFGVTPLQQYLIDTGDGRLQTLRHTWDARPLAEGGQRWFLQYPDEDIPPGDILHWMGMAQNWNSGCADCHTTGFSKGFDAATSTFNSTFAEMGVGCEACHGPGSTHAKTPTVAMPAQAMLQDPKKQPDVCAPCHARREQISEGFTAGANLLDYYVPQLLNPPLYHADGQIDDEVYVYGSFVSSKMFNQGVTCGDCHTPHSASLKIEGDGVCLQCHSPVGNPNFDSLKTGVDYTSRDHHQHDPVTTAARCVTCHMPSKVYMGVDVRHDHSLRIPNHELSVQNNTPSVCASCHSDAPAPLTASQTGASHFAEVLVQSAISAERTLSELAQDTNQNAMVRATALSRITLPRQAGSVRAFDTLSRAEGGLLRHTAATGVHNLSGPKRLAAFKRLLADPLRAVRINAAAAALNYLDLPAQQQLGQAFTDGVGEYLAANELNAEHPGANVNLALAHLRMGNAARAETYLVSALSLNQDFVPALLNYADLLRNSNRDREAEPLLLRAVNLNLPIAEADYAYAMWLVRNGSSELALGHLRRAFETDTSSPQWAYAYVIALHSLGQSDVALGLLRSLVERPIYQEQLMYLHASIARDVIMTMNPPAATRATLHSEAVQIMQQLVQRAPSNSNYQALSDALNQL